MKIKNNKILILVVFLTYLVGLCKASAYYDPNAQRWLNRDPISSFRLNSLLNLSSKYGPIQSGVHDNLYALCNNSSISYGDADGRLAIALPVIGGGVVIALGVAACLANPSCRATVMYILSKGGTEALCMAGLLGCLSNPWIPPCPPTAKPTKKDCRSCYNECLNDGSWPSYKCP